MIKYKLHKKLGPVKMPTQKNRFPNTFLPFIHFIRLTPTSGSCIICMAIKYPRSFLNIHHMTSSCTQALRKKVKRVAMGRERRRVLMEEW